MTAMGTGSSSGSGWGTNSVATATASADSQPTWITLTAALFREDSLTQKGAVKRLVLLAVFMLVLVGILIFQVTS